MAGSGTPPSPGSEAWASGTSTGGTTASLSSVGRLDQTHRLIASLLALGYLRLRAHQANVPAQAPAPETPLNRVDSARKRSVNVVGTGAPRGPRAI